MAAFLNSGLRELTRNAAPISPPDFPFLYSAQPNTTTRTSLYNYQIDLDCRRLDDREHGSDAHQGQPDFTFLYLASRPQPNRTLDAS